MTDQTSPTDDQLATVDPAALTERYEAETATVHSGLTHLAARGRSAAELQAKWLGGPAW